MTARAMTADMLAAIVAGHVNVAVFYEGAFINGSGGTDYLRLWTGVGSIDWNGATWSGGGRLLDISPITESGTLKAVGFDVTITGVLASNVAIAVESGRRSRRQYGKLWLAVFDAAGALVADPYLLKRGKLNKMPISDDAETATITVRYEDRLLGLQRASERRWTHEDQQLRSPGDLGFEYVEALQDQTFQLS